MRKYFYIAVGGMTGAMLRFFIKNHQLWNDNGSFPFNTLFVNITGCFLLSLFLVMTFEFMMFDPDLRLGIATGLLGAYTTFSALCKETAALLMGGKYLVAFTYIGLSAGLGLLAAFAGIVSARKIIALLSGDHNGKNKPEMIDDLEVL